MPRSESYCIVGGGGYVGWNLSQSLLKKGHKVILFDIRFPDKPDRYKGAKSIQGNITDYEAVKQAFTGCDGVFHLAAYGMTGRESLNESLIRQVNVVGTENVVNACLEVGVSKLVYASTSDVVWCNTIIENGTEDNMPYLAHNQHVDQYGLTKTIAEKFVLRHDRHKLHQTARSGDQHLRTVALRFHGIYGPGEMRVTHRVLTSIRDGQLLAMFSSDSHEPQIQYVSGANCVQACEKALDGLSPLKKAVAGGQAYFIVDGPAVGTFSFWQPVFTYFGKSLPSLMLPYTLMFYIGWMLELISRVLPFEPLMTRKEVNHSGLSHSFSIEKAKTQLGFDPEPADLQPVIDFYRDNFEQEHLNRKFSNRYQRVTGAWPLLLGVGMVVAWLLTHNWVTFTILSSLILLALVLFLRYLFYV